jgi:hypothetical protein
MKNMEREKFEGSLKGVFEKAEVTPSDSVWTNIELDLERQRGGQLKKRLMFYQMLAAASVVFAMAIGGIGYYNSISRDQTVPGNLAMEAPGTSEESPFASDRQGTQNDRIPNDNHAGGGEDTPADPAQNSIPPITGQNTTEINALTSERGGNADLLEKSSLIASHAPEAEVSAQSTTDAAGIFVEPKHIDDVQLLLAIDDRGLSPLYTPGEIALKLPELAEQPQQVDPVMAMLARLDQREKEVQGEKKIKSRRERENENENLWTSIGFAAGSFSSVQSSVSGSPARMQHLMAATAPSVEEETKASGYSYSMGVNVGTKLSEKWVLQGGVNYLTHASQYTANNVVASSADFQQQRFRAASSNDLLYFDSQEMNAKVVYTAPYNVNNNMRYLSIPMQAGYLIVDKTFGVQLNAGVATDLFLQNTVSADSDQLDETSQSGGSDSPYRSVNLSGLFGTEVSYRFGEHYRVSLNPGIRYPFNTIYKSEFGLQSTPLTFDVGLRFRYIFH